jgi:hypothetical protein
MPVDNQNRLQMVHIPVALTCFIPTRKAELRIRICRIRKFYGLPGPDPCYLYKSGSFRKKTKKSIKNLDFFSWLLNYLLSLKTDVNLSWETITSSSLTVTRQLFRHSLSNRKLYPYITGYCRLCSGSWGAISFIAFLIRIICTDPDLPTVSHKPKNYFKKLIFYWYLTEFLKNRAG